MNADWIAPDWPAPSSVKALITTRAGGVSAGPYSSMNVGFSTGDAAQAVEENRRRLRACLPGEPRWLKRVHSTVVDAAAVADRVEADASIAPEAHTVCAVLVADCLPVLFTDRAGSVVAVAHAGWRGLAGGVIQRTVERLREHSAHALIAYIGPGIGPATPSRWVRTCISRLRVAMTRRPRRSCPIGPASGSRICPCLRGARSPARVSPRYTVAVCAPAPIPAGSSLIGETAPPGAWPRSSGAKLDAIIRRAHVPPFAQRASNLLAHVHRVSEWRSLTATNFPRPSKAGRGSGAVGEGIEREGRLKAE